LLGYDFGLCFALGSDSGGGQLGGLLGGGIVRQLLEDFGQVILGIESLGAAVGVTRTARKFGVPVIAICGSAGADVSAVYRTGILAVFTALQRPMSDAQLAESGREMLILCSEQVARLLALSKRITGA